MINAYSNRHFLSFRTSRFYEFQPPQHISAQYQHIFSIKHAISSTLTLSLNKVRAICTRECDYPRYGLRGVSILKE
jgi:hypothetical protein